MRRSTSSGEDDWYETLTRIPEDDIIGEELPGADSLSRGRVWCLDPLDGTHNFISGLPLWAVCIGMCSDGIPALGVIHAPALGLTWTAFQGQGAYCNNEPLSVADSAEIVRSDMIAFSTEAANELRVDLPHSQRNLGSAALHCAYLASGAFKACLFASWWVWDVVPGAAIGFEAGAAACNLHGEQIASFAGFAAHERNEPLILGPASCCDVLAANTKHCAPQSR